MQPASACVASKVVGRTDDSGSARRPRAILGARMEASSEHESTPSADDDPAPFELLAVDRRADELGAQRLLGSLRRGLFGGSLIEPRIGRYVLGEILGRGGAGVVYRAHDPELGR